MLIIFENMGTSGYILIFFLLLMIFENFQDTMFEEILIEMIIFFILNICLLGRESGGRDREQTSSHPLIHSPNAHTGQSWAMAGARNRKCNPSLLRVWKKSSYLSHQVTSTSKFILHEKN